MKNNKSQSTVLMLFLVVALGSCKNNNDNETTIRPIPVVTETISLNSAKQDISVSGNVEGNTTVKLGFMVAGKINKINVSEGQNINKGQLLATLETDNYSIAKEIADIQVNQAADEYSRLKLMHDRKSISESDFKKIDFTLQGAKAQQKLQNKNLSDTKLFSPIHGILLSKEAEAGEIVGSGTPILTVSDISSVKVSAYIPENQLNQIQIGHTAQVFIGALNQAFTGKITEVGGVADVATRAFTIKIEVPNPKNTIRPGMIAEVKLASSKQQAVIAVPASAILRSPDGQSYVYVANKENGQAFQRNISVGSVFADRVQVISGLTENEMIVTGGQQKLTNGSKIAITNK